MTKAELIGVIIDLHDYTYTHDEMMRMTKKQLIDHFYRIADPSVRMAMRIPTERKQTGIIN